MSATPWRDYWREHPTSNSFNTDYSAQEAGPFGVIGRFWQAQFKTIKQDDYIVDLGAGNGALSGLFLNQATTTAFKQWDNLDYAEINQATQHPNVYHQQGDMHALPYAADSIDIVYSMYGIEYSQLAISMAQVVRVLKSGGQSTLLMHHPDSVITVQSKITIAVIEQMRQSRLFTDPNALQNLSYDALKRECLMILNQHLQQVPDNSKDDVKLIGQNVFNILQSNTAVADIVTQLAVFNNQLNTQCQRLHQQVQAATDAYAFVQQINQNRLTKSNNEHTLFGFSTLNTTTIEYADSPIAISLNGIK